MMGRREDGQGQFFYSFDLDRVVPPDHLVRQIDGLLDLSWVHNELAPFYSHTGRPSIDPVLMIRMLIVGYVFALRSERRLCAEVQVNLAYRWFCKLGIEDNIPDHSVFCRARGILRDGSFGQHVGFSGPSRKRSLRAREVMRCKFAAEPGKIERCTLGSGANYPDFMDVTRAYGVVTTEVSARNWMMR